MGTCFQLLGSQPDKNQQAKCLEYRLAVYTLAEQSCSNSEQLAEGTPLQLVNTLRFVEKDAHLLNLAQSYKGLTTYRSQRFQATDGYFMFDNQHNGMICSVCYAADIFVDEQEYPNDHTIIQPGLQYRMPTTSQLPLDAIVFYVMRQNFVPNLKIHDDYRTYQQWFQELDSLQDTRTLSNLDAARSIQELAQASIILYQRYAALIERRRQNQPFSD